MTKEVNIELPFYPSHLRFVHGDIRGVVFETRTVQVCRENTLHMQHAPTGGARPSGRLSDLRAETSPHTQTAIADHAGAEIGPPKLCLNRSRAFDRVVDRDIHGFEREAGPIEVHGHG